MERYVENDNFNELLNLMVDSVMKSLPRTEINLMVKELINSKFSDEEKDMLKNQLDEYLKDKKINL